MSSIGRAIGGIVGGITGSSDASKAAGNAADTQAASAQMGIEEQKRQFDETVKLMKPFVDTGSKAIGAQADLIGLNDPAKQQAAINAIMASPEFSTMLKIGEESMLQNASATGGLRGGNLQGALMEFRPQLLAQLIESQYNKLGGLSSMGQASAAGQASMGQATANNVSDLLGQAGAAIAGGKIAKGNATRMAFGDVLDIAKVGAQFMPKGF